MSSTSRAPTRKTTQPKWTSDEEMVQLARGNFREMLRDAKKGNYAVGAFNIFNYLSARAAIAAAAEKESPAIIQTSMSTVRKFGVRELSRVLHVLTEEAAVPVVIHLDHCTSVELAKECIDAGWDSVMIDASKEPLPDNVRMTNEVKEYASKKGVCVEGEIGVIKGVEEGVSSNVGSQTTYDDVVTYLTRTGVDALAPSIGTVHGLYRGEPVINFELVRRISSTVECPVVVHGGTGLSEETFRELVRCGASKINISTALKHSYLMGCKEYVAANPESDNPLRFDDYLEAKIKDVVKHHLDLFGSSGKVRG